MVLIPLWEPIIGCAPPRSCCRFNTLRSPNLQEGVTLVSLTLLILLAPPRGTPSWLGTGPSNIARGLWIILAGAAGWHVLAMASGVFLWLKRSCCRVAPEVVKVGVGDGS